MARLWGVRLGWRKASQSAYWGKTLWTRQLVRLATSVGRAGNPSRTPASPTQFAACSAKCALVSNGGKGERQNFLEKTFSEDHTLWWHNRQQRRNSCFHGFWNKEPSEALRLRSCSKPSWVDAELASLEARVDHSSSAAFPWSLSLDYGDQLIGPGSPRCFTPEFVQILCQQGQVKTAVEVLEVLVGMNSDIDKYFVHSVLKECVFRKDLMLGAQVHALAVRMGFGSDTFLCNHLIRMYSGHGKLQEAMDVFQGVALPDAFMWTSVISAHVKQGQAKRAVELYQNMRGMRMKPNGHVVVAALQACAAAGDLQTGRQVHHDVLTTGLERNIFVCNTLVDMYAKCDSLTDARRVFDALSGKDVVTWNAMIAGYARVEGMGKEALNLYNSMHSEAIISPDVVTFVSLLQACANTGMSALEEGKQLHSQLKYKKFNADVFLGGSLVNMYVKCGSLKDARVVFGGLREKNVVTWNVMIAGYAQEGMIQEALGLLSAMYRESTVAPNAVTFVCLLQACANAGMSALETGKQLHSQLKDRGVESDVVVGRSLVNMYLKCGSLKDARLMFDQLSEKNVVTWNSMIAEYAQQEGLCEEAFGLYSAMETEGMAHPDAVTFTCLLQTCANMGVSGLEKGKKLHAHLKVLRLELDMVVGGSLINMYVKCGSLNDARLVFDGLNEKNVVTWTAMITGYAQEDMGQEAFRLYSAMDDEGLVVPDAVTFVCLLQACANEGVPALEKGQQFHSQLKDRRLTSEVVVGGSLVNMYVKCGSLKDARIVFDGLSEKNIMTWTAMIAGYAQQEGMGQEALNIYSAMRHEGITTPDAVTYVCLLEACANVGALQQGKELHSELRGRGFESNAHVCASLVKMYAKCGSLEASRKVFDRLPVKNLVTWTALIKAYAENGEGGMAIRCFEELLEHGIQPDEAAYACLFTACSHGGLVDQGQEYFETMVKRHSLQPTNRLYCCMVDLFGRWGHLDRAEEMLRASGLAGDAVSWRALLSACKSFGDAETAKRCFDHLVKLEPTVATTYVLMGGIYANAGRWDEVGRMESLRMAAGARKVPGKACIEVKKEVHEFTVGEERSDVGWKLRKSSRLAKEGGHVPHTQLVLRSMSQQEKEDALCGHAEKLALAYGLLNTPAGSTLVVTKNLRMCNDCHSSTKVMSRVEKRQIVVRDGHKVHRFQNGSCTCQDRP